MYPIKCQLPERSYHGEQWRTMPVNKQHLKTDFHHKCAYCDDLDRYYGGSDNYHVDHFAPKARFRHLQFVYDNLLYSCPFCNRAKSDKWVGRDEYEPVVGEKGFINPCDKEYFSHLERNDSGEIVPTSNVGEFMYTELKFFLDRHRICFMIEKIDEKRKQINAKRDQLLAAGEDAAKLEETLNEVNRILVDYYEILFNEND